MLTPQLGFVPFMPSGVHPQPTNSQSRQKSGLATNPPIKHIPGNGRYSEKPKNPVLTGENPGLVVRYERLSLNA